MALSFFGIIKIGDSMNAIDIINLKKTGNVLKKEELEYMIMGYVNGNIPDYQMSALLMAICINGMNMEEIFDMTDIMIKSGDVLDFSYLGNNVVDKHSTGGVGDKTTLVLAPLVASTGVNVAKMSGRGLGFTGGTIDKLESIEGFKTVLTKEELMNQVENVHVAVVSGNINLVPADKKIYALRDVTGTVESIPLIASSIMSKKIAAGTKKIVIDVKVGSGALMKNEDDARKLANTMIEIGKRYSVKVVCVLSKMSEPLGFAIGNGLEVKETIDSLKGIYASDFLELIKTLGTYMTSLGLEISLDEAKLKFEEAILENKGYLVFENMVKSQNGNINNVKISDKKIEVKSMKQGFIHNIDALKIANLSLKLGSGRENLSDIIDHGVGIWLNKKTGDFVNINDTLATIYIGNKTIDLNEVLDSFDIRNEEKIKESIIIDVIL